MFNEVLEESVKDNKISPRSTYMLFHLMSYNDLRLRGKVDEFIKAIENKPDGQQRDFVRILLNMEINEDQEGEIYSICIELWTNTFKKPATRYLAFQFIFKTAKKYPELKQDIKLLTDQHYLDSLSRGVKHSVNKILKQMK